MTSSVDYCVLVLDHTRAMLTEGPLSTRVDLDVSSKTKGIVPNSHLAQSNFTVGRTYWTSAVENSLEIRRVLNDIFFTSKKLCILGYDNAPKVILDWTRADETVNISTILDELSSYGTPNQDLESLEFEDALTAAMDKLSQVSDAGLILFISNEASFSEAGADKTNFLFLKCLSEQRYFSRHPSLKSWKFEKDPKYLKEVSVEVLVLTNQDGLESEQKEYMTLKEMKSSLQNDRVFLTRTLPCLRLWQNVMKCLCRNFKLACSIVSNIPMKEEQQKHSSFNYDVELLHEAEAHHVLLSDQSQFKAETSLSSGGLPAVNLKWLSPKLEGGPEGITNCIGTYRISPLDVLARHSTCLTNFLTSGRTVTLEQSQKNESGAISVSTHVMTCHAGVIYLHILAHSRPSAPLDDGGMPSVTECPGGKLLDYRVTDFVKLMKSSLLRPVTSTSLSICKLQELRSEFFNRKTKFFPLTLGQNLLTNLSSYLPLLMESLTKAKMTSQEFASTCDLIKSLSGLEKQKVSLPISNVAMRPSKRDDQYKLMWSELASVTNLFAKQSGKHKAVHTLVTACKTGAPYPNNLEAIANEELHSEVINLSDDDHSKNASESRSKKRKISGEETTNNTVASKRKPKAPLVKLTPEMFSGKKSLYDVWNAQMTEAYEKKRKVFSKRHDSSYSLYCHVNLKDEPTAT